jgi:hypothetical protein
LLGFLLAALSAPCGAGVIRQLTDRKATRIGSPCLGDTGTRGYLNSCTNHLAGKPGHRFQIFSFDTVTGAGQQMTNFSKVQGEPFRHGSWQPRPALPHQR